MRTKSFSFELPPELIAQFPSERRDDARLMLLGRGDGTTSHHTVRDLPRLLPRNSLLVLNNSRVRKARLFATRSDSGSVLELLFVERLGERRWLVSVNKSKRQRVGVQYDMPGGLAARVVEQRNPYRVVETSQVLGEEYFEQHGHVPLPPYIRREDRPLDESRYQTVFARHLGSVAAPTAGLHLTEQLLGELRANGHEIAYVTLHVGLGTFLPVRSEHVEEHVMHKEHYAISKETASTVNRALREARPVVAVGTTTVRALESAALDASRSSAGEETGVEGVVDGEFDTELFIRPGFRFRIVTSMFTNFHTPESSLLMLVAAFAGRERILSAYAEAVNERYRFFSYGDAMLIR